MLKRPSSHRVTGLIASWRWLCRGSCPLHSHHHTHLYIHSHLYIAIPRYSNLQCTVPHAVSLFFAPTLDSFRFTPSSCTYPPALSVSRRRPRVEASFHIGMSCSLSFKPVRADQIFFFTTANDVSGTRPDHAHRLAYAF